MPSNGLENSARPRPALLACTERSECALSGGEGREAKGSQPNVPALSVANVPALPALLVPSRSEGSGVEGSLANASAASRSQRRRPVCVLEAAEKDLQNPPFLIATRVHSPEESTRCKTRAISFPNRHKIHFVRWEPNLRLATRIVVRYYPVPRLEGA